MNFKQDLHVSARTREIERIFQENKAEIEADIHSLELSLQGIAQKYKVNDRNVRRWCERVGVDPVERVQDRRKSGKEAKRNYSHLNRKTIHEDKPQAHKLVGLW